MGNGVTNSRGEHIDRKPRKGSGNNRETSVADNVDTLNDVLDSDEPRRSEILNSLEKFKTGDKVTFYTVERRTNGNQRLEEFGIINDPVTYIKTGVDDWRVDGSKYQETKTNHDLMSTLYNNGAKRVFPGEPNFESRTEVTGKYGKSYDGLRYAKGVYDTMISTGQTSVDSQYRNVYAGRGKSATEGLITEYNGTLYGLKKVKTNRYATGGYEITHVPSGLGITQTGQLPKSLSDASKYIKQMDVELKSGRFAEIAKTATERFKRTVRADVATEYVERKRKKYNKGA